MSFQVEKSIVNNNNSVSIRIAHYLFLIIVFAGIITSLSTIIMVSNRSDAELINVSGSLRMQSYRLLHIMEYEPQKTDFALRQYRVSLHSTALVELRNQPFISDEVKEAYRAVIYRWQTMESYAQNLDIPQYRQNVADYVEQLDKFVYALQEFAEKKLAITLFITLAALLLIVIMVSYVIWYAQKQVVRPLHKLMLASQQIQKRQFNHIPLDTENNNELGTLAKNFTHMASELSKLYMQLEKKVSEKTQKLNQTNRSLAMLYYCSQQLTVSEIDRQKLLPVLQHVMANEHLKAFELQIYGADHWHIHLGKAKENVSWFEADVGIDEKKLGLLRWQAGLPCPDPRSMENIAQLLGRCLYFNQTQRQQQQLVLMEERSIIARELHDSLAQVLSFLQIQLTLLKHNVNKEQTDSKAKSLAIIQDFEQALSDGYIQLRELISTFRLTVQEANLQIALQQTIDSLKNQTDMQISVECTLPSQLFEPQQLIHALQIVREAVLNAIKHSKGTHIEVLAQTNEDGENEIIVRDNGVGIPSLNEPEGHYGLNIMHERSQQLNAKLSIQNISYGGTEVKIILPCLLG